MNLIDIITAKNMTVNEVEASSGGGTGTSYPEVSFTTTPFNGTQTLTEAEQTKMEELAAKGKPFILTWDYGDEGVYHRLMMYQAAPGLGVRMYTGTMVIPAMIGIHFITIQSAAGANDGAWIMFSFTCEITEVTQ